MKKLVSSVRARLVVLSLGLVFIMGSANALLGFLVQQNQKNQQQQEEQFRELESIENCDASIQVWRHVGSKLNTEKLMNGGNANDVHLEAEHDAAQRQVYVQLKTLKSFDPAAAETIARAFESAPSASDVLLKAIMEGHQNTPEGIAASKTTNDVFDVIESTLFSARSQVAASTEAFIEQEKKRVGTAIQLADLIIVSAGILGFILALVVVRSIIRPLQATTDAIRQVNMGLTEIDLPPIRNDEFGDMALALRQFRDQAENLRKLAYYDPLTGLGNRAYFEDSLQQAIGRARASDTLLSLFYIDLDNFRAVNDRWGHKGGDRYICEAVSRLNRFVMNDALLCRYEGDNFAVLTEGIPLNEPWELPLREKAETILRGMSEPYPFEGQLLNMSVSVGISVFPNDGESPQQLVSAADAAMYVAKRAGRNNVRFASAQVTGHFRKQLALANDIRRGMENNEFEPFFQPIIDVLRGRVVGAEALLRWRHPQRGLLLPGEFIEVAEESGLINRLGEQCLIASHRQNKIWRRSGREFNVAVNLSVRQVQESNILETLRSLNGDEENFPNLIDFELTESALLDATEHGEDILEEIKRLGYRLGLDDFGTGYSSFSYLRRLPIDKIKIDRQFVATMGTSRQALAIISAIVTLANTLELGVVAEGVETLEQSRHLSLLGSNVQQGFFYTKALPVIEFDRWTAAYERQAALDRAAEKTEQVTIAY